MTQGFHEPPDILTRKARKHQLNALKNKGNDISNAEVKMSNKPLLDTEESRREFLKPSLEPNIHFNAIRTETIGRDIYIGDIPEESKEGFLNHEVLHVTFYDYENAWTEEGVIKDLGEFKILKSHPRYEQYSEREKVSEDFVASAGAWITGRRFKFDIRNGWITENQAKSRMKFFDDLRD